MKEIDFELDLGLGFDLKENDEDDERGCFDLEGVGVGVRVGLE